MKDSNITEDVLECSVCLSIMVEPIRIKCGHLYCLECIEQIIINGKGNDSIKCPMDRLSFDYLNDLKFDKTIQSFNYATNAKSFFEKANRVIESRRNKENLAELTLAYGNFHTLINSQDQNQHQWSAFVSIKKIDSSIKQTMIALQEEANIENRIGLIENDEFQAKLEFEQKINKNRKFSLEAEEISDNQIIKKVTFKLHPTFTPSSVFVLEAPFKINRIGWGAFNIIMTVEFHDYLDIDKVELDHFLNFSKPFNENQKTFLLNMGKLQGIN
jgi:hypothetical protein